MLPAMGGIARWIDVEEARPLIQHTFLVVVALACGGVVELVAQLIRLRPTMLAHLHFIEEYAFLCLMVWFLYQLGVVLWNRRIRIGASPHAFVLA